MQLSLLLLAALVSFSAAKPLQSGHVVKETHRVPREFTRIGDAPGHKLLRLSVGLKQSRFQELERHLYESNTVHSHIALSNSR